MPFWLEKAEMKGAYELDGQTIRGGTGTWYCVRVWSGPLVH